MALPMFEPPPVTMTLLSLRFSSILCALALVMCVSPWSAHQAARRLTRLPGLAGDAPGDQLAEAVFLDLSARGHRELGDDLEALRELVARELVALQEPGDLRERQRLVTVRDDHGAGAFAQPGVGHGHDGDARDFGM